ncbi:MAG TPA: hypothetical protein DEH00_08680 [Candidatus Marinimicrobia bacterium]|nr:hypothetical protein [Candidatus Neomarinimicrobiota bacterium]
MHITYIDESGTPEIPGNSSHYVLAGLSIPIDKWKKCERDVQKIKDKYCCHNAEIHTGWLLWPYFEQSKIPNFESMKYSERRYHVERYRNNELLRLQRIRNNKLYYKTKKNYNKTHDYIHLTFDERKKFATDIAELIGKWSFARLFAECIDKFYFNPTRSKYTLDEQAFEQVVSRFEQYLRIYSHTSRVKKFGLLIHDNNNTVSKRLTELMKQFHNSGTLWTSVRNIIETPLFVDSQLTSMVQLADLCSYALRRYIEKNEDYLYKEIIKRADKKGGKMVGVRHFTDDSCECNICKLHR